MMIENHFYYKGFLCRVSKFIIGRYWGDVAVPKGHKCEIIGDYDDIPIDVPGGLRYAQHEGDDLFWIGFECENYGGKGEKWNEQAVIKEIESMVDQLDFSWKDAVNKKLERMPNWFKEHVSTSFI